MKVNWIAKAIDKYYEIGNEPIDTMKRWIKRKVPGGYYIFIFFDGKLMLIEVFKSFSDSINYRVETKTKKYLDYYFHFDVEIEDLVDEIIDKVLKDV
jgi:hypothetical protein